MTQPTEEYKLEIEQGLNTVLGRDVVFVAADMATKLAHETEFGLGGGAEVDDIEYIDTELQAVRDHALECCAKPFGTLEFNKILDPRGMPTWLLRAAGLPRRRGEGRYDIARQLASLDPNVESPISNETLLNILEFHNHRQLGIQRRYESRELPERKRRFKDAIARAVENNWIPHDVIPSGRLNSIDDATVWIDDGSVSRHEHFRGMAKPEANEVVIDLTERGSQKTFDHEAIHLITPTDRTALRGMNQYGLERIFGSGTNSATINEAVTEHLALALSSGRIDSIRPLHTVDIMQLYTRERRLLHALCNRGVVKVPVTLFVEAMLEDEERVSRLGADSAQTRLRGALQEAFPFTDIVRDVNDLESQLSVSDVNRTKALREFTVRIEAQAKDYSKWAQAA